MADALELQSPLDEPVAMLNNDVYLEIGSDERLRLPLQQIAQSRIIDGEEETDFHTDSSGSEERKQRHTLRSNTFKASAFN